VSVGDGPRTGDETRRVDQDAPFLPSPETPSGPDSGGRVRTPGTGVQAARDAHSGLSPLEQIERLAALLEPEAFDPDVPADEEWRERAQNTALGYAARAITAGYRRVVEDDTTVDRVAAAMFDTYNAWVTWEQADEGDRDRFRDHARVAVRALRGDQP
jgi:hypothetical protein